MPIVSGDIKKYLSGGAANADPNAALGGAISSTEIVDDSLNNLFAFASAAEADAGSTKYRAFFVKNTHATLTYQDVVLYISVDSISDDTEVRLALADEAIGVGTIETIVNENTAPVGPTFELPILAMPLTIGDLAPGEMKGIWVRWVITAGASAILDEVEFTFSGETSA